MLVRDDQRGALVIGQQSHAWLSGQLARAWGNARFGTVEPYEEVCLAADQHDVGWGDRDQQPRLSPETGLPQSFMQVPLKAHLELFTEGPKRLVSQSRYAALLVSMHGWRLYERRDLDRVSAEDARAIRGFLAGQERFQSELRAALGTDASAGAAAEARPLERNSMLIWTWDYLSLALCLSWAPATARRCPSADGEVDLELSEGDGCFYLDPWPLRDAAVSVHCEGRRLAQRYEHEAAMREALAHAPWETLQFQLRPR